MKSINEKEYLWNSLLQIAEVFSEHYPFVSNVLIVLSGKKQAAPLIELEKAFTHIFKAIESTKENNTTEFLSNIDRFAGHIERMLLDMYKLCFSWIVSELDKRVSLCGDLKKLVDAKKILMQLRNFEMENIGASLSADNEKTVLKKKEVLKRYKEGLEKLLSLTEYKTQK